MVDTNNRVGHIAAPAARRPAAGPDSDGAASSRQTAQDEITRLRGRLLGGHGPGASARELARYMHDRMAVGTVPTVAEREIVQARTALARGDADAIASGLHRAAGDLAETVAALASRLAPEHLAAVTLRVARSRGAHVLGVPGRADRRPDSGPVPRPAAGEAAAAAGGDQWWWRIAARSAALGAAAMLGLVLLARRRVRKSARRRRR